MDLSPRPRGFGHPQRLYRLRHRQPPSRPGRNGGRRGWRLGGTETQQGPHAAIPSLKSNIETAITIRWRMKALVLQLESQGLHIFPHYFVSVSP